MSPEQVSRRPVDARSDVYSLGVTLYEVLTLKPPFAGDSDHRIQQAILFEEPTRPRKLNPRIRRDLETILLHALEKNPERRYASAGALASDLRRYLADEPIAASRASRLERGWRWTRRNPALAALLAVLVAVGLGGWSLARLYQDAQEERARVETEVQTERLLWAAQRSYADGQYQEALAQAAAAVKSQPGSTEARLLQARLLLELERLDDVVKELNKLVAERPDLGAAHYLLAAAYRDRNPEQAESHRQTAAGLLEKTADAYHLRAMAETRLEDAVKWLNAGLELESGLSIWKPARRRFWPRAVSRRGPGPGSGSTSTPASRTVSSRWPSTPRNRLS